MNARFAFADTTLLRDTLDLHFTRLFPLADSLRISPDTLRALSVRYQMSLERMVVLADSLRVPIDSVGVTMAREQFSPLAANTISTNAFRYTSSYSIGQTNSTWNNTSDYSYAHGPMFLHSLVDITLGRYDSGGYTSLRQTRSLGAEVGWRVGPGLSLGGRANIDRFANLDRSIYNVTDDNSEFQLSLRSKQKPARGLSSEFNVFSGLLRQTKTAGAKNGVSGEVNGRVIYKRADWLSHSLDGQLTGNMAKTAPPDSPVPLDTRDYSSNLRGTLSMLESLPVGLNVGYGVRASRVETPVSIPSPSVQPVTTNSADVDVAVRGRIDNDRYLNLHEKWSKNRNSTVTGLGAIGSAASVTTSTSRGFTADGRYLLLGWTLDASFLNTFGNTGSPRRLTTVSDTVDYHEGQDQHTRSVEVTLSRSLTRHLIARLTGDVSLDSYDYTVDDPRAQPTYPRDQYNQSYRIEGLYTPSDRFNTGITLLVSRTLFLNLTSSSSSSNSENRAYTAEWRWNARLLPGLTATQRNNVTANYDYLVYQVGQDRLSLDYSTVTTLNAVLTPRLTLDINHNVRYQPRGGYNKFPDGQEYFVPSDESRNYILVAHVAYTPVPALSLTVVPDFEEYRRNTRTGTGTVPQSLQRTLNFSGGANLNLPVGNRGRLTGNILRTLNSTRQVSFTSTATPTPASELDYWNGSLQFTWSL